MQAYNSISTIYVVKEIPALTARGRGKYVSSIEEAARDAVKIKKVYTPDETDYTEAYARYVELDKLMN